MTGAPASPVVAAGATAIATLHQVVTAIGSAGSSRPPAPTVVTALLAAEKAARRSRPQFTPGDLVGTWQLCFSASRTAPAKAGQGGGWCFYVPQWVGATLTFAPLPIAVNLANPENYSENLADPATLALDNAENGGEVSNGAETGAIALPAPTLQITNQLRLGALRFYLTGPARYPHPKNLLAFDFADWTVALGDRPWLQGSMGVDHSWTHFQATPIAHLPFFAFFAITPAFIAARGRGGGLALWRSVPTLGATVSRA